MPEIKFTDSVRIVGTAYKKSTKYVEVTPEIAKIAIKAGVAVEKGAKAAPGNKDKGRAPENK